jgi:predicted  nucleic acid-binding Zn-ribbon protein
MTVENTADIARVTAENADLKARLEAASSEIARLTREGERHQREIDRMHEAERAAAAQADVHKVRHAEALEHMGAAEKRAAAAEKARDAVMSRFADHRGDDSVPSEPAPALLEPVRRVQSPALSRPPIVSTRRPHRSRE